MPIATYKDLCIDAVDPAVMARFWQATLGLKADPDGAGRVTHLTGPTEQHGVDDEEGEHPTVLRGGRRPRRVVVEAQIPPEPGDCEIVGHRATLGTRSREPRVGR